MVEEVSKELQIIESGLFEKELKKKIYEKSYYEFFKVAYAVLLPGETYSDNWHIKYLCDRLQQEAFRIKEKRIKKKDIIINIPYRSAKSLIVTQLFNAWAWTIDNTLKFICTSYSGALSLEHATNCRTLIYSSWYQDLWGDKIVFKPDINATGHYALVSGGSRKSVGMGGQITGSGGDFLILDDPQNPKMAASIVERQNVISFYKSTLYNRLNQLEVGVRIIVMQRLHMEDLSGHLIDTASNKYEIICIPVEVDMNNLEKENLQPKELIKHYSEDGLFWKGRFSKAVIADHTTALGPVDAAGQLYQRPAPKEGNMVKSAWFDIVDPTTIERDLRLNPINFYIDTAESEEQKTNGDYTAILSAFLKDNCVYICNVVKVKKEFHELVKFIIEWTRMNLYSEYSMIKIEPKSSGKSVHSEMKAVTGLNVVTLPSPKDDKIQRLSSITPKLASKRVKLLAGSYVPDFMDNLTVFPNGKNDDDVDVFIHCVEDLLGANNNGFDFAFV